MAKLNPQQARAAIKYIVNKNFTFADLANRFKNVDSSTGNIFCPFHSNHESPAAKMYWDDEHSRWVLHCFGECHRNYTTYDYLELILCNKYGKYRSPLDFLKLNMAPSELLSQIELVADKLIDIEEARTNVKIEYINKVAEDYEETSDYIEVLYTA